MHQLPWTLFLLCRPKYVEHYTVNFRRIDCHLKTKTRKTTDLFKRTNDIRNCRLPTATEENNCK